MLLMRNPDFMNLIHYNRNIRQLCRSAYGVTIGARKQRLSEQESIDHEMEHTEQAAFQLPANPPGSRADLSGSTGLAVPGTAGADALHRSGCHCGNGSAGTAALRRLRIPSAWNAFAFKEPGVLHKMSRDKSMFMTLPMLDALCKCHRPHGSL